MSQDTTIHLAPPDLARRWRVTVGHLANLRSTGGGPPHLKVGGKILYRLVDIEDFEARSVVRAGTA